VTEDIGETLVEQTTAAAQEIVENPWVQRLARLGLAVRGLIYGAIGLLAGQVALGARGAPEDYAGLMALIAAQPLGRPLLTVVAAGLAGLAVWGFSRVLYDPLEATAGGRGRIQRFGYFISGASYAALLLTTLRTLSGLRAAEGAATDPEAVAATLLTVPWGVWLVAAAGVAALTGGAVELYRAIQKDFEEVLQIERLRPHHVRWACRLGRWGTAARGVAIALVGVFLVQAALWVDPSQVKGMDEALLVLAREPDGPWLLLLMAAGLIAFGVYSLLGVWWFRLKRL
jgi:hypothetical protein